MGEFKLNHTKFSGTSENSKLKIKNLDFFETLLWDGEWKKEVWNLLHWEKKYYENLKQGRSWFGARRNFLETRFKKLSIYQR